MLRTDKKTGVVYDDKNTKGAIIGIVLASPVVIGLGLLSSPTSQGVDTASHNVVGVQEVASRTSMDDAEQVAKRLKEKEEADAEEAKLATGDHCLSGWDGSFPRLKDAVKQSLRDPSSFDHVSTVRSPVDAKGKFGLIMTYRAANGFGGLNVEAVGVEVEARSCEFKPASNASLARRLRDS